MAERTYPYEAWVLQPSFKPKLVKFVAEYGSRRFPGEVAAGGKFYRPSEIFATKADAIAGGRILQEQFAARIAKFQATYDKRQKALEAAATVETKP